MSSHGGLSVSGGGDWAKFVPINLKGKKNANDEVFKTLFLRR